MTVGRCCVAALTFIFNLGKGAALPYQQILFMAYDPTLPANNSPIVSAELRNQFGGLKDEIDAQGAQLGGKTNFDDVNDLISQHAASNVDDVAFLDITLSDPPTKADVQAVIDAHNNLVQKLQH